LRSLTHRLFVPCRFLILGGYADFLLPSVFANAHGAITGLANLAPHTVKTLSDLSFASHPSSPQYLSREVILTESQRLQGIVANADRTVAMTGVSGTKWLLRRQNPSLYPLGSECPRRPLLRFDDEAGERLWKHRDIVALMVREAKAASIVTVAAEAAAVESTSNV